MPTPPPAIATGDGELAAWLTATHDELTTSPDKDTAQAPTVNVDVFTASYLDHRATEMDNGPGATWASGPRHNPNSHAGTDHTPDW